MDRTFWKGLAGGIAAALLCTAAAAQEIKISHQWKANTDGRDKATRVFVREVEKRDPSLKFRIYPGSSLNIKPVAQLDALQAGSLEMAVFPMSYAVGKIPEMSITIMPGTIASLDQAMKLEGSAFHKKLQEIAHRNGIHIMTWWWTPGGFASKNQPIGGPDTVKGEKMRAADPTFEAMLKAAGASVVNIPSTEIYPSFQSGVLTSALTSAETFVSMRIYEQTKYATAGGEYTLWWLLQPLVMAKSAWDKLTPAQKKAFEEAAKASNEFFAKEQATALSDMVATFKKNNNQVRALTKAEYDAWIALAKKTAWPEFTAKSAEAKQLLDLITGGK
jgi:TRAP-type transport system periplasmic protein